MLDHEWRVLAPNEKTQLVFCLQDWNLCVSMLDGIVLSPTHSARKTFIANQVYSVKNKTRKVKP